MVNYNVISGSRRGRRYSNSFKPKVTSTVAKYPHSSKANKPVLRKLAAKPKATITKTGRNKQAITTLARQVKTLQNQRFGEIQTHTQYGVMETNDLPTNNSPCAFLLNSFYDQNIYRGTVTNGFASYVTNSSGLSRQTYQSDLDDSYEWNARRNAEIVSPIEYKPVFTRLSMTFHTHVTGIHDPIKYRVTVFKIKDYIPSNKIQTGLPSALGAYRHMCEDDYSSAKNFFDKKFHTVVYDKWITVYPNNKTSSETSQTQRRCTITWKYNDQVYRPNMQSNNETFWATVPKKDQMWVLVSASDNASNKLTKVEIGKFDVWRDSHGANQ